MGLAFAVFWGTMFPILSEAARGERITVGQGYYDQVAVPIGAALLVLTGVGPADRLAQGQPGPAAAALRGAPGGGRRRRRAPAAPDRPRRELDRGARRVRGSSSTACIAGEVWRGLRVRHALGGVSWPGAFVGMVARNRRRYGGYAVHLGIVVLFIGLAGSKGFATEADLVVPEGGRAQVAGYTLVNEGAALAEDAHKSSVSVRMGVFRDGERVATMSPGIDEFTVDGTRCRTWPSTRGPPGTSTSS